jgi:hypothetical protein
MRYYQRRESRRQRHLPLPGGLLNVSVRDLAEGDSFGDLALLLAVAAAVLEVTVDDELDAVLGDSDVSGVHTVRDVLVDEAAIHNTTARIAFYPLPVLPQLRLKLDHGGAVEFVNLHEAILCKGWGLG